MRSPSLHPLPQGGGAEFGLGVWRPQDRLAFPGGGALNSLGVWRPNCVSLQTCVHCLEAFCSMVTLGQDPQLLSEGVREAGGKQAVLETPWGNMRTNCHPTDTST